MSKAVKGLAVLCVIGLLAFGVGCTPKMVVVGGTSNLLPGVVYVGAYTKHPTGMNSNRTDLFQDGKLIAPGNTVASDGIVNNAFKGSVGHAAQAGGFIGGMAVRRPDTTNVTTNTNTAGTVAAGAVNAAAANAVTNKNRLTSSLANANVNANTNVNKQAQGQFQGQQQKQRGSFTPGDPGDNGGGSGKPKGDRPGWGYGDGNHNHTGPPGLNR
jgi:hypothetical protein